MNPKDAHDAKYATDIKINLLLQAQSKRKYPQPEVGDLARGCNKKDTYGARREYGSNWTNEKHNLAKITYEARQTCSPSNTKASLS